MKMKQHYPNLCSHYYHKYLFMIIVGVFFVPCVSLTFYIFSSRLPFRGPDNNAEPSSPRSLSRLVLGQSLTGTSSSRAWILARLTKSPTSANSNEQTRRFQITCQLAVNSIVYCKTFYLPEDFVAFHFHSIEMEGPRGTGGPGMVRVTGAAIEKEFAQFLCSVYCWKFSTLAWMEGSGKFINCSLCSKDSLKAQVGKLLVYLLNPNQDLDLSCFALNLLRERTAVYLLKILAHPGLTYKQRRTGDKFKAMMLSLNLQSMRLNAGDCKVNNDEEMQLWDSADKAGMMQWQKQRFDAYKRLDKRTEDLSEAISTVAKDVTRVVVEIQDTKRQALLKHTRDALSAEVQIRKKVAPTY
ncbi:hypothetical protein OS493_032878 [Desmophyllum pertusum]|uniref:Uncharacterized protein n=1 Tax=Desmophyllum pertusum TaxID=174260 RepID=A0A9X0CK75_9CNID|nr:hypothetical protein OS493_032878 [Desmophyllum pertusum]